MGRIGWKPKLLFEPDQSAAGGIQIGVKDAADGSGLAAARLPMPLGGTSNHFRTRVLQDVGGWDPYNVTEDADLGMRLYRFGYRCGTINRPTYEEAPTTASAWLGQRTRWFKGWLHDMPALFSVPFGLLLFLLAWQLLGRFWPAPAVAKEGRTCS